VAGQRPLIRLEYAVSEAREKTTLARVDPSITASTGVPRERPSAALFLISTLPLFITPTRVKRTVGVVLGDDEIFRPITPGSSSRLRAGAAGLPALPSSGQCATSYACGRPNLLRPSSPRSLDLFFRFFFRLELPLATPGVRAREALGANLADIQSSALSSSLDIRHELPRASGLPSNRG